MPSIRLQAIKPGKQPTAKEYTDSMKQSVLKSAKLVERDLEATARTWDHEVKFVVVVEETAAAYIVVAGTDDDIYHYVDAGTKAHDIKPKRSKYLRWYGGYRAKTRVGIIGSQGGGASGEAAFSSAGVHHPGTKARNFIITIQKRRQATIVQEIAQGLAKVARKQG